MGGIAAADILKIRDLFPERGSDELLATAVCPVAPTLPGAMMTAVPRLEFRLGPNYQLGGYRMS
ncbi:hypothetical protein [Streptomyces sp. NPDC050804]|uniref:hypothetical protein n=1 Tax=Streptomyces sp. NPDC050804 TaxID=3154745 RepID=UPI0034157C13